MFRFETDRLVIKPHTPQNAARYQQWESDPELIMVLRDHSDTFEPRTLAEIQGYIDTISQEPITENFVYFAIYAKADDDFIGYGMIMEIERHHRRALIGLTIGEKSWWGKGLAREALIPVINYCFDDLALNRIMAEIYAFNERSRKLFESLGFKHEGTLRQNVWKNGGFYDDTVYGLLRDEWKPPA